MKIQSHKDLIVWKKSMQLVKEIYEMTDKFPKDEMFGLNSQLRRAAVSIPSNIAEGYLRKHRKEYLQFLSIALGSSAEIETQILICKSLNKFRALDFTSIEKLNTEVIKMLFVMIEKLNI